MSSRVLLPNLAAHSPFLTRSPNSQLGTRFLHPLFTSEANATRSLELRPPRRCRLLPSASSLVLPLLPFSVNEVLIPTESKELHLFEARYLALLEEIVFLSPDGSRVTLTTSFASLVSKKLFVHFVLDPVLVSNSGTEASFAARYGCLVVIESVERLQVGALVSIRGIGRVKLVKFTQADPYLRGEVIPLRDWVHEDDASEISAKVKSMKEAVYSLNRLEIKLKAPKDALLQTRILNSLTWAEEDRLVDCDEAFIPSLDERISFAALQPVSGSAPSELFRLQTQKLQAMELKDTSQRLRDSLETVNENISILAAKLAIQALDIK